MNARAAVAALESVELVPVIAQFAVILFADVCVECLIGMDDDVLSGDTFNGAAPLGDAQCA